MPASHTSGKLVPAAVAVAQAGQPYQGMRLARQPARVQDLYFGGALRITGTVKNTPATPVARRVLLHLQKTGVAIRETWSHPTTGAYAFDHLAPGTYYVTAFDHTGQYGAVVESDIAPEPMP